MNILDAVETWWIAAREGLEATGIVGTFTRSSATIANPSCYVTLELGSAFAELIVWTSGMADFNFLAPDKSLRQEHFEDVRDPHALGTLLLRLASVSAS